MNITIEKEKRNPDEFTLHIQSGHFTGTLVSIPKESVRDLGNLINKLLDPNIGATRLVWNPRSGRHEIVKEM